MSTESDQVCSKAIVREIKENYMFVEMTVSSACAACHAKGACGASEQKKEKLKVFCSDPSQYRVGEIVDVELKQTLARKAVLIAYFFPFLVMILGLFGIYAITKNELLSIGVSFGATALYYFIISKLKDKLEKEFVLTVKKSEF
jgi:positive regulator of sigma E activity